MLLRNTSYIQTGLAKRNTKYALKFTKFWRLDQARKQSGSMCADRASGKVATTALDTLYHRITLTHTAPDPLYHFVYKGRCGEKIVVEGVVGVIDTVRANSQQGEILAKAVVGCWATVGLILQIYDTRLYYYS